MTLSNSKEKCCHRSLKDKIVKEVTLKITKIFCVSYYMSSKEFSNTCAIDCAKLSIGVIINVVYDTFAGNGLLCNIVWQLAIPMVVFQCGLKTFCLSFILYGKEVDLSKRGHTRKTSRNWTVTLYCSAVTKLCDMEQNCIWRQPSYKKKKQKCRSGE